jgi:hypothetical protein
VTTTPPEVIASEVVVTWANAEERIAAVQIISATFSSSNERRAAVFIDVNWSGEDMLLNSQNCAPCSGSLSMEETRRKPNSRPDCRFEKETCAIELEESKFPTTENGDHCTPISSSSNV